MSDDQRTEGGTERHAEGCAVIKYGRREPCTCRSAGRWCAECNQHGSHHTDKHAEFAPLPTEAGDADPSPAPTPSETEALRTAIESSWMRPEHDPSCGGNETYCALHCPTPWMQAAGLEDLLTDAARAVIAAGYVSAEEVERREAAAADRLLAKLTPDLFTERELERIREALDE